MPQIQTITMTYTPTGEKRLLSFHRGFIDFDEWSEAFDGCKTLYRLFEPEFPCEMLILYGHTGPDDWRKATRWLVK